MKEYISKDRAKQFVCVDIATRYAAKSRASRAIVIGWHLSIKNLPLM